MEMFYSYALYIAHGLQLYLVIVGDFLLGKQHMTKTWTFKPTIGELMRLSECNGATNNK